MGLETPTYISDLNSAWPLGADGKNTADDHLRNFKAAVKATFPNVTGAVTATHTQLNAVLTNGTAVASTSGASIDFTSIPSWVKKITINLSGVSFNTSAEPLFQLGSSGGIESTGYTSTYYSSDAGALSATTGFSLRAWVASTSLSGSLTLTLLDASTNTWVASGAFADPSSMIVFVAGSKSTSATLDRIRITSVAGTSTFDAGKINIQYQ